MKYTTLSEDDMDVVQPFAFGGIANPIQRATLRASDREYLAARQKELDAFEEQRQGYNTGLAKYQEEVYNPYQQQAQAYNTAAKQYNTEVYEPYQQQYGEYEKAINAFNEGDRTADYAGPAEPVLASQFEMKAPTTPGGFDMSAPVLPFKEEDVQARQQQAAQTAQRDAGNRATALNVASNPEQFGFGSMSVNSQFMAKGGPVNKDAPYGPGGRAQFEANLAAQEEFSRGDNPAPAAASAQQSAAQQLAAFVGPRASAPEMAAPQAQTAAAELGRMSFGPQAQAPASDPSLTLYSKPPGSTAPAGGSSIPAPPSGNTVAPTPDPDGNTYGVPTSSDGKWLYNGGKWFPNETMTNMPLDRPDQLIEEREPAKPQLSDAITQLKGNDKQSAEDTMRAIVGLPPLQRAAPAPMPEKPELSDAITRLKGNDKQGAEDMMRAIVGLSPIDRTGGAAAPAPATPAPAPTERRTLFSRGAQGGAAPVIPDIAQPKPAPAVDPKAPSLTKAIDFLKGGKKEDANAELRRIVGLPPLESEPAPRPTPTPTPTPRPGTRKLPDVYTPPPPVYTAPRIDVTTPVFEDYQQRQRQEREREQATNPTNYFARNPLGGTGNAPGTVGIGQQFTPLTSTYNTQKTIAANPNLSPGMLGGRENAGVMTDRLGNKIISPAMPLVFAEGGEVDADDSPINTDPLGSAQQFMAQIVQADRPSPTRQSVKRLAKNTGGKEMPKEMGMNAGSLTTARDLMPKSSDKGSSRQQMEDFIRVYQLKIDAAKDKARGLASNTFGAPTLEGALLTKNTLAKKRFNKGGEAKKSDAEKSEDRGFFSNLFKGSNDDFIKGIKNKAEQGEDYRAMLEYLKSRGAVPDVKTGNLPFGVDAVFNTTKLPIGSGTIKINKDIVGSDYKKDIGPSTLAHEMAHAADRQFEQQASEQTGVFRKGNNFTDAYEKIVGSGGMREGQRRTDLARKYHPKWAERNKDYRATPYEIAAHGVGKYAGSTTADEAPPHVDATAATEFQILLDLAQRNSGAAVKRAKGGIVEDIGKWLKDNDISPADLLAIFGRAGGAASVALAPSSTNEGEAKELTRRRSMPATVDRAEGSPEEGELSQAEIDAASRPAFVSPNAPKATKISRANDPTDRILGAIEPAVTLGTGAVAAAVGMPRGIYKGLTSGQVGQGKAASIASKEAADFIERNTYVPRSESGRENLAALGKIAEDLKLAPTPGGAAMASLARPAAVRAQGANIAKDFQQYNRQLAVPGASYAVRPEGSTLVVNKLTGADDYSNWIPTQLNEAAKDIKVNVPQEKQDLVKNFWDVKALNYFSKQFGTESDPVYKGIKEQTIKSPALDKNFRKYALDQLAVGKTRVNEQTGQERFFPKYPEAHDDLRKRYDDMTGIEGSIYAYDPARVMDPNYSYSRTAVGGREIAALKDREIDRMIAQGTPASQANVDFEYLTREVRDPTKIFGSNPVARDLLAAFEKSTGITTGNSSATVPGDSSLPQNLVTGMLKGEPMYTTARADKTLKDIFNPEYINQYLVSLPERELKNVRFEDAVKGGAKLSAQRMQRETLAADIRAGKRVPDKFFSEGVSAPLLQFGEGPLSGFAWKRIEKAESTVAEGAYVGHSVGGYAKGGQYGPEKHRQFNEGVMQVFTLRDARNRPVNTLEVKIQDSGPVVTQIKGNGHATGNKPPVDYDTGVLEFMQNYLKPVRITEEDRLLTPLLLSYKDQLNNARTP